MELKIGKWNLEYKNGKYWLYNPKGLGGALHFYFNTVEEYNEAVKKDIQLLGFEGSYLPNYVYKNLLKYHIHNINKRAELLKSQVGYITLNNWGGIAVLEVDGDYVKWMYSYGGDKGPIEIHTSEIDWIEVEGEDDLVPVWYTDDNKTDYYRIDEVMKTRY